MAVNFNSSVSTDVTDMSTAGSTNVANNAPIAVVCWINFAVLTGIQQFVSRGFASPNTGYMFQMDASGTPALVWGSFDGAVHGVSPTLASLGVVASQWYQLYGDYTGTGGSPASTWRFSLSGGSLITNLDTTGPINIAGRNFTVGGVNTAVGVYSQPTFACIADVGVFAGPLTPTERTNLANGTLRPNTSMSQSLLGYWSFDVVGTSQTDLSGNGATGTYPQTTPTLCASSPPYVTGAVTNYAAGPAAGPGIIKRVRMIGT